MTIPADEFIDVDFPQTGYDCGAIPDSLDLYMGMREFDTAFEIIPRSKWPELIEKIDESGGWLERRIRRIKNQGREGTCVYNMLGQMMEVAFNKQFGDENWIELSPVSGYRWNAPGPGTGSNVSGSLSWGVSYGLLPARTDRNLQFVEQGLFKHTHPSTGYYENFQNGWQETARLFRVHEFLRLTTVEAWFTALFLGFPCGGGRDSHAICHVRPLKSGSSFLSLYANSWGNWGSTYDISPLEGRAQGFGADSESKIRTMVSRGAFCIATMLVPPWHFKLAA